MQMVKSGAEGHPFPVRVYTGIDPVKFLVIDFLPGKISAAGSCEIAVDAGLTFVLKLVGGVEETVVGKVRHTHLDISGIVYLESSGLRRSGGDDYHSVGSL